MDRQFVARSAGWNPARKCWEFVDLYWEDEFPMDNEWLDDGCVVVRREMVLWREVRCMDRARDGSLAVREATRESRQSYVLAQRICEGEAGDVWSEPATLTHPVREDWDVESEFWRRS